ncbi:MAG: hypothetical protein AAF242_21550, partial [Bacteroidota bacterium]
ESLWQGVDAVFYDSEGQMKYDFVVAPQADPTQIRFSKDGATDLSITKKGELAFQTPHGTLKKGAPYTYQIINGKKKEVKTSYSLEHNGVSFKLGKYNKKYPLIIDPIALKWATFLGSTGEEEPYSMVVDENTGRIYTTGLTTSSTFPVTTGVVYAGDEDVFVTCLEADGSAIVWSTLIGGSDDEEGRAIALNADGDVFVAGVTRSSDFPLASTIPGFDETYDSFVTPFLIRLNPTGTVVEYSTLYDNGTVSRKLVVDGDEAYFGISGEGSTRSGIVGFNTSLNGTASLISEIFYNSDADNFGLGISEIERDQDGNFWVVGSSSLRDNTLFPITANAAQTTAELLPPDPISFTPFASKFSPAGDLLYSS